MKKNKSLNSEVKCKNCLEYWGGFGFCKRHSPYHTVAHMGFWRWLWVGAIKSSKVLKVSVLPLILKTVASVVFFVLFLYLLNIWIDKQEIVTCKKLNSYSQTYPLFYMTETGKAVCDGHGVYIDAPVKKSN